MCHICEQTIVDWLKQEINSSQNSGDANQGPSTEEWHDKKKGNIEPYHPTINIFPFKSHKAMSIPEIVKV